MYTTMNKKTTTIIVILVTLLVGVIGIYAISNNDGGENQLGTKEDYQTPSSKEDYQTPSSTEDYQTPSSTFRNDNLDTYLASISSPYKIFSENGSLTAVDSTGSKIQLGDIGISLDVENRPFFDKAGDRVFYFDSDNLMVYDISNKSIEKIPINISDSQRIGGVHLEYITLIKNSVYAAQADFETYNINTGSKVEGTSASSKSSEFTQRLEVMHKGKKYYIYTTSKTQRSFKIVKDGIPTTRTVNASSGVLEFYLFEESEAPTQAVSGSDSYVFGGGESSPSLGDDYEPLLYLNTSQPDKIESTEFERAFRIRNLYSTPEGDLALEVDSGLAIINLEDSSIIFNDEPVSIAEALSTAVLVAPPIGNNYLYYIEPYCENHVPFSTAVTLSGGYLFCVE